MCTEYIKCSSDLQQEIDDAKNTLITLNDNIRRIIGRNPREFRNDKTNILHDTKKADGYVKRRINDSKSVFHRLSSPVLRTHDDESRPRLPSRIIRELPTRQEIVEAQGTDSESRARNKRMFGSLIGTLHKFCQEESRLKKREDKKALVEKKLEDQQLQEREILKKERELLFLDRKRKQLELKNLELKMNILKDFEVWESSIKNFKYHIKTNAKPYIYFKPRHFCKVTEKKLLDCQKLLDNLIQERRNDIKKELAEIEVNLKTNGLENEEQNDISESRDFYYTNTESRGNINEMDEQAFKNIRNIKHLGYSKKDNFTTKENESINFNEPTLFSSVVAVQNVENQNIQ